MLPVTAPAKIADQRRLNKIGRLFDLISKKLPATFEEWKINILKIPGEPIQHQLTQPQFPVLTTIVIVQRRAIWTTGIKWWKASIWKKKFF